MWNRFKKPILAILPAIMLYLAWPPKDAFILMFFAFVPWFILERETRKGEGFFWWLYLGLVLFNLLTTWWVWYASNGGAVFMIFANSLLMSLPFILYRKAVKHIGEQRALLAFVCYWLGFEYLHLNWEITWPWLSLGNSFAKYNGVVQWYEFTGMMGGSLWVLLVNVLIYRGLDLRKRKPFTLAALVLIIPAILSIILLNTNRTGTATAKHHALVVQPNVDPYLKFNSSTATSSLKEMLAQISDNISDSTDFAILPETAIVENVDEDHLTYSRSLRIIDRFMQQYPKLHLLIGASTYNFYEDGEKRKPTVRKTTDGFEYESYNTAFEIDVNGVQATHHKSKLVPGVEKMPYPMIFKFLEPLAIDMGGVTGSLGADENTVVFEVGEKADLAPMICYESVFPDYVRSYVAQGAEIILVMTNDGWWGNTDGYKQHKYYGCLRAIETRREVLRSANTGISCHIDAYGNILQETNWWEKDVLKVKANSYKQTTFFTRHGNYIGKLGAFLAVVLILSVFVKSKVKHRA